MKKWLPGLSFLLLCFCLQAQVKVSPSLSTGYLNQSSGFGINTELGIDYEFILPRIDLAFNLRYSLLDASLENQVNVLAASSFISYVFLNGERHRIMFGPGITIGKYISDSPSPEVEKNYKAFWINPIKLRYDYYFGKRSKIGVDLAVYGVDENRSVYLGFLMGFLLR